MYIICSMIQKINTFLFPLTNWIEKQRKYIWYFFLTLSFWVLPLLFFPSFVKDTGEQSSNILYFILFLPIFSRVFSLDIAQVIMPLRKEMGILMGTLAFVHGAGYIFEYPSFFFTKEFWWQEGMITYFSLWFLTLVCTIPLLLTSNTWSIKLLGKYWKSLHRWAYLILIFTVLHVVLLNWVNKWEVEYDQLFILILYFFGKTLEWRWIKFGKKKQYPKWQKWICIPCGYIYDPRIWDEKDGIVAGTEFVDISDSWKCPDCWVSKSDFIPYEEGKESNTYPAIIKEKTLLNPTTLELVIETENDWKSIPGQFMRFFWKDDEWIFSRMYSIVKQNWKTFSFIIKLSDLGRWAKILQTLQVSETIHVGWVHGKFILNNNTNPKICIASGTGLSPIYHMLTSLRAGVPKSLYFSVATKDELFYVDKLRALTWLDLHIHVTREKVEWCHEWRIDASTIEWDTDTEWYLCGNPKMILETKEKLIKRWFDRIYSEEFI